MENMEKMTQVQLLWTEIHFVALLLLLTASVTAMQSKSLDAHKEMRDFLCFIVLQHKVTVDEASNLIDKT